MGKIYERGFVELILENFKERVESGDYIIIQRDKNIDFITEFNLTEKMQKTVLLSLMVVDYSESEESRNFADSYVHKFNKTLALTDANGNNEKADMHIKFEIERADNGEFVVVISFHRQEYPPYFPFAEMN